jgi:hypothetical protein
MCEYFKDEFQKQTLKYEKKEGIASITKENMDEAIINFIN